MSRTDLTKNVSRAGRVLSSLIALVELLTGRTRFYLSLVLKKSISLVPRNENLWLFGDGVGGRDRRGGNSKYLFLQLANSEEYEAIEVVWVSRKDREVDVLRSNGYTAYRSRSLGGRYALLRAGKIFCTNGMDFTWWLTGGAEIVQLWHGIPIGKAGYDVVQHRSMGRRTMEYRKRTIYDWEYLITTSKNPPADVLRRAFDIDVDDTLVTGYPRTDVFFEDIEGSEWGTDTEVLERLSDLPERSTVFMYAPTWRRDYSERGTDPLRESGIDFDRLDTVLDGIDGYLLLKPHPMTVVDEKVSDLDRVLVVESDSDPYPLLEHVDSLITDYSSIFVDYLLLDRPVIFFPYDLEEYVDKEGLYYTYDSISPGFVARNTEQLYEKLGRVASGEDPHETERAVTRDMFHDYRDGESAARISALVR